MLLKFLNCSRILADICVMRYMPWSIGKSPISIHLCVVILIEAAWQAIRYNPVVRKKHLKVMHGDDKRKRIAIVAVAHYLARIMLAMLKNNQEWDPGKVA